MTTPTHNSIQWTLVGPVVCVRKAVPDENPGTWKWGRWKPASIEEQDEALLKIRELNKL